LFYTGLDKTAFKGKLMVKKIDIPQNLIGRSSIYRCFAVLLMELLKEINFSKILLLGESCFESGKKICGYRHYEIMQS